MFTYNSTSLFFMGFSLGFAMINKLDDHIPFIIMFPSFYAGGICYGFLASGTVLLERNAI
jgi:ABC-type long-subunit fatty acid transport system fused permease/ATPase subunit